MALTLPSIMLITFAYRHCPGILIYFVDAAIYIICVMCLAVFDISKYVDPTTGEAVTPVYQPLPGIVRFS